MTLKKWILLGVLVLVIAAGTYWMLQSKNASANISDKDLITAQRVDFPLIVSATGTLEATRSVSITPPQVRRQRRFNRVEDHKCSKSLTDVRIVDVTKVPHVPGASELICGFIHAGVNGSHEAKFVAPPLRCPGPATML